MKLDASFDTVEAKQAGVYENPPSGPYVFVVVDSSDKPSESGKDMITLSLDIVEGPYAGAFEKYPKQCRQLLSGDGVAYFKGMLNAFKGSNAANTSVSRIVDRDRNVHHDAFRRLIVGGMLRDAEYANKQGEIKMGQDIAYFFPVAEIAKHKPVPPKTIKRQTMQKPATSTAYNPPPHTDDDMLF